MKEYFYILDWIIITLGFLTLCVLILLGLFLIIQRFMRWKHKDFMTYRHIKILSTKDKSQFWEYIHYALKQDLTDVEELELIRYRLEKLEDNSIKVSRRFNNKNFEFRNILEEEIKRLDEE